MIKRIVLAAALVLAAVVISTAVLRTRPVHAQTGCDATTLTGAYGYNLAGSYYDTQSNWNVVADTGRIAADGAGNLTGTSSFMNDSYSFTRRTLTGTYTLNSDCTGSAKITYSDKEVANMDIVVVNNGKEFNMIQTDTAVILNGTGKKITQ